METLISRYYLMHQNRPVAIFQIAPKTGDLLAVDQILDDRHFPLGVAPEGREPNILELRKWWKSRGIPASRQRLERALAALSVPDSDMLLLKCSGLSLTDQYWVTPCSSPQNWHEVNFFENDFSDDVGQILFQNVPVSAPLNLHDPSCSSNGNLQKQWKIINGQRFLLKGGTSPFYQEPLNECAASELFERLQIFHVPYTLLQHGSEPVCACPCFVTKNTEYIPASAIMNAYPQDPNTSTWQHFLYCCDRLGIPEALSSVSKMLAADFILANTDRHLGNFGALRNADTLEWYGMAPVFDSGTSLWQLDQTHFIPNDHYLPSMPFAFTQESQLALLPTSVLATLPLEHLKGFGEVCQSILMQSKWIDEQRAANIAARVDEQSANLIQFIFSRQLPIDR